MADTFDSNLVDKDLKTFSTKVTYFICWVWSLIIFYIQKYRHIGPQFKMGAAAPPVKYSLQGVSRGGGCDLWEPPPWRGVSEAVPPKLKKAVKLPCKSIVISSQSGPFIRRMI